MKKAHSRWLEWAFIEKKIIRFVYLSYKEI